MPDLREFFTAVTVAYLAVCGLWLLLVRLRPRVWPAPATLTTDRRWLDLALTVAASAGILLLGQAYRAGYLLRGSGPVLAGVAYSVNQLIIFAPIAVILAVRRQGPQTVFLSGRGLPVKVLTGLALGVVAVAIYVALRGELHQFGAIWVEAVRPRPLMHFLPVFLEGVALAFAFVRIRWAFGLTAALLAPSLLFAIAHVPRQLEAHLDPATIAAFLVLNTLLPAAILYVVQRSQDVIWLGIVHYFMDVAIRAFEPS